MEDSIPMSMSTPDCKSTAPVNNISNNSNGRDHSHTFTSLLDLILQTADSNKNTNTIPSIPNDRVEGEEYHTAASQKEYTPLPKHLYSPFLLLARDYLSNPTTCHSPDQLVQLCSSYSLRVPLHLWTDILALPEDNNSNSHGNTPLPSLTALISLLWGYGSSLSYTHPSDDIAQVWPLLLSLLSHRLLVSIPPLTLGHLEKILCTALATCTGSASDTNTNTASTHTLFACILKLFPLSEDASFRIVSLMPVDMITLFENYVDCILVDVDDTSASSDNNKTDSIATIRDNLQHFLLLESPTLTWPIVHYLMREDVFPQLLWFMRREGSIPYTSTSSSISTRCIQQLDNLSLPSENTSHMLSHKVLLLLTLSSTHSYSYQDPTIFHTWSHFLAQPSSQSSLLSHSILCLSNTGSNANANPNLYHISALLSHLLLSHTPSLALAQSLLNALLLLLHEPSMFAPTTSLLQLRPSDLLPAFLSTLLSKCTPSLYSHFIQYFIQQCKSTSTTASSINTTATLLGMLPSLLSSLFSTLLRNTNSTGSSNTTQHILSTISSLLLLVPTTATSTTIHICSPSTYRLLCSNANINSISSSTHSTTLHLRLLVNLVQRDPSLLFPSLIDDIFPLCILHRSHTTVVVPFFELLLLSLSNTTHCNSSTSTSTTLSMLITILIDTPPAKRDALYSNTLRILSIMASVPKDSTSTSISPLLQASLEDHPLWKSALPIIQEYQTSNSLWKEWCTTHMDTNGRGIGSTTPPSIGSRQGSQPLIKGGDASSSYLGIQNAFSNLIDNFSHMYTLDV